MGFSENVNRIGFVNCSEMHSMIETYENVDK